MKLLLTLTTVVALGASITAATIPWGTPAEALYISDQAVANGGVLLQDPGLAIIAERGSVAAPEMSATTNQIIVVRDGQATLITGGTLKGNEIKDGQTRRLKAGDVLVIPAKTPYWWKEVPTEGISYIAVRRETPRSGNTWGLPDVVQHITAQRVKTRMTDPGGPGDPILIDPGVVFYAQRKFKDEEPEIHLHHSHIFVVIDGEATFLTGEHGAPIAAGKAVGATKIHQIRQGGIMIVPSTTPHQWVSISGNTFGPKDAIGYIAINMDDPR